MKPIRVFRHLVCQPPGYLGEFLRTKEIPWEMVCVDQDHPIPERTDDVSALVFMGAAVSVNDQLPWVEGELRLIRKALDEGLPLMGVCFGAQLMSKALGGTVSRGRGMEIGWHPLERIDTESSGWFDPLPQRFEAFHWHADTFSLPSGAHHILRSDCFPHQGFLLDDCHLGLQFHLEMTRNMVEQWVERYGSDLQRVSGCGLQCAKTILSDLDNRLVRLHEISDLIYGEWLECVIARQAER
jgi:GMP synthase-like glutamine amidotransferase